MFQQKIAKVLAQHLSREESEIATLIERPPEEMGDFAFPCFALAKELKKAPAVIAEELAEQCKDELFSRVEAKGPYVNFFLKPEKIIETSFEEVSFDKKNKKVVIEFSSPNIAKPFGIGHLRSTVIGAALARTYELAGWDVVKLNHLGDWGTQFGKLIWAYKKYSPHIGGDTVEGILQMFNYYVDFHKEAENNPAIIDKGREEFRKLEQGDEQNKKLWEKLRKVSIKEFEQVYKRLNVTFDSYNGESFYTDKMPAVVDKLEENNLLEESEGAQIVNLEDEGIETPALIMKKDGSTLYLTRDLAAILYRKKEYQFDRMLYEVGNEQALHFKQLFAVTKKLGYDWHKDCEHVGHGLYRFPDGKMSTRKGKTIFVDEVLDKAVALSKETIQEKNPELKDAQEVAEIVGVGAIMFNDLKNDRVNDINFSWKEILNFEGESGPYLQYTYARLKSILRKSTETPTLNPKLLTSEEEIRIAKQINTFPEVIEKVISTNKPHSIARYALDLAQLTNTYYQKHKIIQEDKNLESARLSLIELVSQNIKKSLELLGINVPEEM